MVRATGGAIVLVPVISQPSAVRSSVDCSVPNCLPPTNTLNEADCAGLLAHLLALERPLPVYLGCDDEPAPRSEVAAWIAQRLGLDLSGVEPAPMPAEGSKRCRNIRLKASGDRLRYPTFREGYVELC